MVVKDLSKAKARQAMLRTHNCMGTCMWRGRVLGVAGLGAAVFEVHAGCIYNDYY